MPFVTRFIGRSETGGARRLHRETVTSHLANERWPQDDLLGSLIGESPTVCSAETERGQNQAQWLLIPVRRFNRHA